MLGVTFVQTRVPSRASAATDVFSFHNGFPLDEALHAVNFVDFINRSKNSRVLIGAVYTLLSFLERLFDVYYLALAIG